jgi:hypothetical protein
MKSEKREEREEVYPQMTQMDTDEEFLFSSFRLHPSSWCLCGSFFVLRGERLPFLLVSV